MAKADTRSSRWSSWIRWTPSAARPAH